MMRNLPGSALSSIVAAFGGPNSHGDILDGGNLYRPGKLKPFVPRVRESSSEAKRRRRKSRRSYRQPAAERVSGDALRRARWARLIAHGALSFRPLGSALTMDVRPNFRWGHMSRVRRVRLSSIAARKSAA